ncbi:MAG TPA: TraM recognition domain-containing protein [Puia sp.]|nr:TraM recognition domain-containing protein [Puia sp.]
MAHQTTRILLVVDEFATVRATSMLDTMATGRSNNITPILVIQDLSQLRQRYSHDEADQIMNTAGNLFCGQITGETAKWVSQRFEGILSLRTTISVNSSDISTSKTGQTIDAITPSTLANLSSGEFVGLTADDPDKKIKLKGFHAAIVKDARRLKEKFDLPVVHDMDQEAVKKNYELIRQQITTMVKEEMKRILGDPQLRQNIVKR